MTQHLTRQHLLSLLDSGYQIFEDNIASDGSRAGHVVVADPVLCISGSKHWAEVKRVTLRTPAAVMRFLSDRE